MTSRLCPEVWIEVFNYLYGPDLLRIQEVSKEWHSLSLVELYQKASVTEQTALTLKDSLVKHGPSYLKRLSISCHPVAQAGDFVSVRCSMIPLLSVATNLVKVHFDWRDLAAIDDPEFYNALAEMPNMESFSLLAGLGAVNCTDLLPCLNRWAPKLRRLELAGVFCSNSVDNVPLLSKLEYLKIDLFGMQDDVLCALFGDCPRLQELSLFLGATDLPTDAAVLSVLDVAGPSMGQLELYKPWHSWSDRNEKEFGVDAVQRCPKLDGLTLHGQIFAPSLFSLPALSKLGSLNLQWSDAIAFVDVARFLQTLETHRMKSLRLMCESYDQDTNQSDLHHLMDIAIAKKIGKRSVVRFCSQLTVEMLTQASRDASLGQCPCALQPTDLTVI